VSEGKVFLVDDEKNILTTYGLRIKKLGFECKTFQDPRDALKAFSEEGADVVILDLKMEILDGHELMKELKKIDPDIPVIILTAHGSIENAVQLVKDGAYDYLQKPPEMNVLELRLKRAIEDYKIKKELSYLRKLLVGKGDFFKNIVAQSPKMKELFDTIKQVAKTDSTIAIYGESGTGKEIVANAIHHYSLRADKPFLAINCGAIPETLLEDELFGHVKGAFTNAYNNKAGLLVQADQGTLFLDEVGEMSEAMQVKLLRVLETGTVRPLGSEKEIKVDVRIVVATKRDLQQMVKEGKFREDFFYRIHVIPLYLPPLRERKEDILLLATHFIEKFSQKMNKNIKGMDNHLKDLLLGYNWPGNVRELENVIEFLVAMSPGPILKGELLKNSAYKDLIKQEIRPLREVRDEFIKQYLDNLFKVTRGNVSKAAKLAGYYRADFYKLFQKYGFNPSDYK